MSELWKCPECNGTGKEIIEVHEEALCEAEGKEWWQPYIKMVKIRCQECRGSGTIKAKEEVR